MLTCLLSLFLSDISVSLLSLVVTACGLALFGVSLFVSWKLCWVPWRERGLPGIKDKQESLNYTDTDTNDHEYSEDYLGQPTSYPDSSMKISHTSPDIPLDAKTGTKENCVHNVRMHRQITEPTPSARSVLRISSALQRIQGSGYSRGGKQSGTGRWNCLKAETQLN